MMHFFRNLILPVAIFLAGALTAQDAEQYLNSRGEVYFRFDLKNGVNTGEQLDKLTRVISIDNVTNDMVYAYANRKEFARFSDMGYPIEVLTPPSMKYSPEQLNGTGLKSNWDYYPTYQQYLGIINAFADDYPGLCEKVVIGQTVSGRKLLAIHINDSLGVDQGEPQFLYTSSMHGDEITGYVLMLRLIEYLLENYGSDARVTALVNNVDIWINPLANPDGTYAGGDYTVWGATRSNANYADLNRNYPDPNPVWGDHPDGMEYQPETMAFMDFAEAHDFTISANMHGGAEVANYPWDTWSKMTADNAWWVHVCRQYADSAQAYSNNNGYFTALNYGITNGYDWYPIFGGRQDYMNYFQQCREMTLELSDIKTPLPEELPDFWEYNYAALLSYMEQARYGLHGIVTDAGTGAPVVAEVLIENHDEDSSQAFSFAPKGDYHRYLFNGTYAVTYRAEGYQSKTIEGIQIKNDSTTIVNVQLDKLVDGLAVPEKPLVAVFPNPATDELRIYSPGIIHEITITDMNGREVKRLTQRSKKVRIDIRRLPEGMYILKISTAGTTVYKKVMVE